MTLTKQNYEFDYLTGNINTNQKIVHHFIPCEKLYNNEVADKIIVGTWISLLSSVFMALVFSFFDNVVYPFSDRVDFLAYISIGFYILGSVMFAAAVVITTLENRAERNIKIARKRQSHKNRDNWMRAFEKQLRWERENPELAAFRDELNKK